MAFPSEFQEREYESLFIQELAKLGSFTWSPGQTDEFFLGFDGALWIDPIRLMRLGFTAPDRASYRWHHFWPFWEPEFWRGRRLHSRLIDEWRHFADDTFPKKSLNFFVQHKRPFQTTEQGACGDHWGQAYFEFKIDKQQQRRLEQLENKLGDAGVVTYSCAAFLKKADLWTHQEKTAIVRNSNFVSAKKLSGHNRYTFIDSGHSGHANPEAEAIEDEPLFQRISSAYERSEGPFSAQVKRAGAAVDQIMIEEDPNKVGLYYQILNRFSESDEVKPRGGNFLSSLLQVMAFNTVNSTSWAIITAPKQTK
jgi:hypothetical protein